MIARLTAAVTVGALIRRVNAAGGMATVLARGDATAGAVLVIVRGGGEPPHALESGMAADGGAAMVAAGPAGADEAALTDYWCRRRARDPDLWVIELEIAEAERFAAETILAR